MILFWLHKEELALSVVSLSPEAVGSLVSIMIISAVQEKRKACGKCIRGILCHGCNAGLGNLRDDLNLLRLAVKYLEKYEFI